MRKVLLGSVFAVLSATASTAVFADDVTIETATGPVTVAASPAKVAGFDVGAIDTMTALGVEIAGVPNKLYVSYLDKVIADATAVGTLFEPDYENLAVMGPDLIVVGGRSSSVAEPLSQIAPVIDMTIANDPDSGKTMFEQGLARISAYGTLFDKEAEAAALTAQIEAKLAEARTAVEGKGNGLIILTNGTKISAFGANSRFGWLHSAIGLPVAADGLEAETHGQSISFEFIAELDPDWLLVVDRGAAIGQDGAAAAATLDNALVNATSAAQNGQIIYLDSAALYIAAGGATSIQTTLDEIIAAFSDNAG